MVTTIQYEGDEKEMPIALPSYNNLFWTPTDIMLDKQVEITKIGNIQGRGGNRRKNKKTRKSKKNRKSRKTKKNQENQEKQEKPKMNNLFVIIMW